MSHHFKLAKITKRDSNHTPSPQGGRFRQFGSSGSSLGKQKSIIGSGSSGGDGGNNKNPKITPISKVDPLLKNMSVQGRCISIWHSHRLNAAHDPYSLDLVLQDIQNARIQIYIKKEFMYKFEPLFQEGQCYNISNFTILDNGGILPLLGHRYKISLNKTTIVTRVEPIDDNTYGFVLESYKHMLERSSVQDAVDVIGSVVRIGKVVDVFSDSGRKIRRTVVVKDADGDQLDLTFWDHWAEMWNEYSNRLDTLGHFVIILQLGKIKYWNGVPAVHNAIFGSKIYVNQSIPEIASFVDSVKNREGYDSDQFKIEEFAPEVKVVGVFEFFNGCLKSTVGSIRDTPPDSHCIVYAIIHHVFEDYGWAYEACKRCTKKVEVIPTNRGKPSYVCERCGKCQSAPRFKVIVRLMDETGSAAVLLFNNIFVKMTGLTTWELKEQYGKNHDEYWPEELNQIVGIKCLFKIWYSTDNANNNNHTYRCDAISEDDHLIAHFKKDFLEDTVVNENVDEPEEEEFTTPATLIKKVNMTDTSVNRVLDMATPVSLNIASGSGQTSSAKKRRVYIDLDDIDTDSDDENNPKSVGLVSVKLEPED